MIRGHYVVIAGFAVLVVGFFTVVVRQRVRVEAAAVRRDDDQGGRAVPQDRGRVQPGVQTEAEAAGLGRRPQAVPRRSTGTRTPAGLAPRRQADRHRARGHRRTRTPADDEQLIVAYEQTGVNGKRMTVDVRGTVVIVTDEEFAKIKFVGGHKPAGR